MSVHDLLKEYIETGRIKLDKSKHPELTTYHDPCNLGRKGGIFEAPREILRAAVNRWVSGKTWAAAFSHAGAPSMENHTSERNIMGQEIKLTAPLGNSSLVTRAARNRPMEHRLTLARS